MEIIHDLIKKIVIIIPILLIGGFFFWVVGKVVPESAYQNYFSNKDILPAPGSLHTIGGSVMQSPIREDNWSTNGFGVNQNDTSYHDPLLTYYASQNLNSNYIRNVNVKKYSIVYSGMVIRGEVKRSFFTLGTFPVFVENMQKSRSFTEARALEPWQIGEWVKFEVVLGQLNQKGQCNLVFKNANPAGDPHFDIYTSLPVSCL